jgi:D-sedoheptulose 7-phosphate isomerase
LECRATLLRQLSIAGGGVVGMVGGMSVLNDHITGCVAAVESLREHEAAFEAACEVMAVALGGGRKVLACGNGGSAADSGHFTTELLCRFIKDRRSLPAISLAQDGGFLTATGNDYGFDQVFSRQVEGLGQPGDVLVGITTSGNSRNVLEALRVAKEKGLRTIVLLGRDGGAARGLAEIEFVVPGPETARIQEAHKVLIHAFCAGIEARLFPGL